MHFNDGLADRSHAGLGWMLQWPKFYPRHQSELVSAASLGLGLGNFRRGSDRRSRFPYQSSWGKLKFDDSLGTHHTGDLNVDCTANFSLVGLVDCDPCYFHQLHRSGRSNHPVSFDGGRGSWHPPLECETIAFSQNSPCWLRASRRRAGCYPPDRAILRFRLVSRTGALRTMLALSKRRGHLSQVLDGRAAGQTGTC